jgi:hypothetical protein
MLLHGGPNPAAVAAIQRQPDKTKAESPEYGLDLPAHQAPYVARALELWQSQKEMTTDVFVEDLMKTIKAELVQLGVPDFKWKQDASIAGMGEFDSHDWIVRINPAKFTTGGKPAKVKNFPSFDEFVEVVGTLYHESRHTDQDLMIIRVLLEEGKKPAEIHADTGIKLAVINKVKKAKFLSKPNKAQKDQVRDMYGAMYGEHKEPLEFVMKQKAAYNGVVNLTDALEKKHLTAAKPQIAAITKWRADVLAPEITSLQKPNPSPIDQRLLDRARKIDSAIGGVLQEWDRVAKIKKPNEDDLEDLRFAAQAVSEAFVEAINKSEGELDAWRVEKEVKDELIKQRPKK